MNFSRLPDNAFLKILQYLPFEDRIRVGRVNKSFRQISQLAISRTKSLDLGEHRFWKLTPDQLAVILNLCSSNLERFEIGYNYNVHWRELATIFAHFQYPRLIDINLGGTPIDQPVFDQLIRNCQNMERLVWSRNFVGFPDITINNLKKLYLNVSNDASLQTLIGRCPNLEELDLFDWEDDSLFVKFSPSARVLDQFFGSIPKVQRMAFFVDDEAEFDTDEVVNIWNLPLVSLKVFLGDFDGDDFVRKVATSFPNLQELRLTYLKPTDAAIASLVALHELQVLKLAFYYTGEESYDQGIRQLAYCQKLRKLDLIQLDMTGGTLVNLLRSCPQLEYVGVLDITQVDSPEQAIVILGSLAGIPKRNITIRFNWRSETFESIWEVEPVKAAVRKLEEEDGLKIMIKKMEENDEDQD